MQNSAKERARECPACSFVTYPPVSPAIIVAVRRGNRLLLGRSPHFPKGRYSVLAGFVEPGESLEEAVAREIFEEVHIAVKDIRYVASQPWPFPHSLMVGFTALWESGEIRIDEKEIEDARWFSPEDLPDLPPPSSISRRLIDAFLLEMGENPPKRAGVPWT
jgi:NAD+ diphosphatase